MIIILFDGTTITCRKIEFSFYDKTMMLVDEAELIKIENVMAIIPC